MVATYSAIERNKKPAGALDIPEDFNFYYLNKNYVTANQKELTKQQQLRYGAVYCGICRQIRTRASQAAQLGLSYDMAFL